MQKFVIEVCDAETECVRNVVEFEAGSFGALASALRWDVFLSYQAYELTRDDLTNLNIQRLPQVDWETTFLRLRAPASH